MTLPNPNPELSAQFIYETMPAFFAVNSPSDIEAAHADFMGAVGDIAGARGTNDSQFDWDGVRFGQYTDEADTATMRHDDTYCRRIAIHEASGTRLTINNNSANSIRFSREGTHATVDADGHLVAGRQEKNPLVDPSYGDPTPYVLEKLGWAKVTEVLTHQDADWGEGYEVLTDFLRQIGRISVTALPHVGMATAHEIAFSEATKGTDRHALAYSAASNYTISPGCVGALLANPRFFDLYKRQVSDGSFTNIADWLAGRVDSIVARSANEIFLGREVSIDFPYLDTPDYAHVDNN